MISRGKISSCVQASERRNVFCCMKTFLRRVSGSPVYVSHFTYLPAEDFIDCPEERHRHRENHGEVKIDQQRPNKLHILVFVHWEVLCVKTFHQANINHSDKSYPLIEVIPSDRFIQGFSK